MSLPRISLCMIAKDEASILPRCLEAVRGAVDEIIVVDTGSSDSTPQIAESFGAKVFHHPWQDDFSESRNHSLDHATGDWVLWLDADEVLQPGGAERIRTAVADPQAAGYSLRFSNILDGGMRTHYLMPRLFLRRPEIRFVNVIHEQILGAVETYARAHGLGLGVCEAKVFHFGYQESEMQRKAKRERTLRLSRKQLSLHPEDPYSWYKFGDFVRRENEEEGITALRTSLDLLKKAIRRGETCPIYAPEVLALLATEEQRCGHPEKANDALDAVEILGCAPTPNFLFARACVARLQGRFAQAVEDFSRCLADDAESFAVPVQWGVRDVLSWYGIAECKAALGEDDAACSSFQEALAVAPQHLEVVLSYGTFLFRKGRAVETLEILTNYLGTNPQPSDLWNKYGEPLLHLCLRAMERLSAPTLAPEKTSP